MADLEPGVILSPSTVAAMERLSTSPRTAMTDQYKATTEQLDARLRELRSRVEALEAAQHNPRAATSSRYQAAVSAVIGKRDAPAPGGSLVERVATDAELCQLYDAPDHGFGPALRAVYDLGRRHGAASIRSAPESPLVERVADAIAAQATSAGIVNDRPARAAILEVAAWMREQGIGASGWAMRLESEAEQ
jgi:hypothetical protein